jgi:hypothetical protein
MRQKQALVKSQTEDDEGMIPVNVEDEVTIINLYSYAFVYDEHIEVFYIEVWLYIYK